jgi:hypothetical protein
MRHRPTGLPGLARHRRQWWREVLLVAMLLMASAVGPAVAAANTTAPSGSEQAVPYGRVVLYATPTVATTVVTYTSCKPAQKHQVARAVISFQHLPLPGCQAVLVKKTQRFVLCAGQGTIPPAFRVTPQLVVQRGATPPCRTSQH